MYGCVRHPHYTLFALGDDLGPYLSINSTILSRLIKKANVFHSGVCDNSELKQGSRASPQFQVVLEGYIFQIHNAE